LKIIYHSDADGRCAAAVTWRGPLVNRSSAYEIIEAEYKDTNGEKALINPSVFHPNEVVIIVDFSLKPKLMNEVLKITPYVIWLDHHTTAFDYEKQYSKKLDGIRDNDYAGCELAWKYFMPDSQMPRAVELIGDRDKWAFNFGDISRQFTEGLKLYPHKPTDPIWDILLGKELGLDLGGREQLEVDKIVGEGWTCMKYRDAICRDYLESFGFETEFEGYKAFAIGIYMFGSDAFGIKLKEYPLCLSFEFDGEEYLVGLYSEQIDVRPIAQKYGGGGHKGAGGIITKELPFRKKR
jgi:oligoribonuclease NrnB/cAMP/cGMP phosphodiesterase (DHH superfamily)